MKKQKAAKIMCLGSLILLVFLSLPGTDRKEKNLLLSYNLTGELKNIENKELVITFSEDMLPLGGERDGRELVHIRPGIAGDFFWRGVRTLVFKPDPRFKFSTRYTVTIPAGARSLNHRGLPEEVCWTFETPPPLPLKYKFTSGKPFRSLYSGKTCSGYLGAGEEILLEFNQPIRLSELAGYLFVRNVESEQQIPVELSREPGTIVKLKILEKIERDKTYKILIKKGLRGVEGGIGSADDFIAYFASIPLFRYRPGRSGPWDERITIDEQRIKLDFSNSIKEIKPGLVKLYKAGVGRLIPIDKCKVSFREDRLIIHIEEKLYGGDRFFVKISGDLQNSLNEKLGKDITVKVFVCSSENPGVGTHFGDGCLNLTLRSTERYDFELFRFDHQQDKDFFNRLLDDKFGILKYPSFTNGYTRVTKRIRPEQDARHEICIDLEKETGSARGLFGILPRKIELFDKCGNSSLAGYAKNIPFKLDILHVRDIEFLLRSDGKTHLFWVSHNKNHEPVCGAKIAVLRDNGRLSLGKTGEDGLFSCKTGLANGDIITATHPLAGDFAFLKAGNLTPLAQKKETYELKVFTDRDIYQPGETIHIGGIGKRTYKKRVFPGGIDPFEIFIIDRDGVEIHREKIIPDRFGGFHTSVKKKKSLNSGKYWIGAVFDNKVRSILEHFYIEFYPVNPIMVEVSGIKENYGIDDPFAADIKGFFLSGTPMSGDSFSYEIEPGWDGDADFLFEKEVLSGYRFDFYLKNRYPSSLEGEGTFDNRGTAHVNVDLKKFKNIDYIFPLSFRVTAETKEGKEYTHSQQAVFFPGDRLTGIKMEREYEVNRNIIAEVSCIDTKGNPAEAAVDIVLYKGTSVFYDYVKREQKVTEYKNLRFAGRDRFAFEIAEAGNFSLEINTKDEKGNRIATCAAFCVTGTQPPKKGIFFHLQKEQKKYRPGDRADFTIYSNGKGKALITVEQVDILDAFVIDIDRGTRFSLPIKEEYFPGVGIHANAVFSDGSREEDLVNLHIVNKNKKINIAIETEARELPPSRKSTLKITTTDSRKKGKSSRIFVYCVDEGVLALRDYETPAPYDFFYPSSYYNNANSYRSWELKNFHFPYPYLDITYSRPCIIGRVSNPDGTPLAGVNISLHNNDTEKRIKRTTSSPNGYFVFDRLVKGDYFIMFKKRGFKTRIRDFPGYTIDMNYRSSRYTRCDVVLERGKDPFEKPVMNHTVKIKRNDSTIRGVCLLPGGACIPGVLVTLSGTGRSKQTVSSESGAFIFENLKRGRYRIEFEFPGLYAAVRAIKYIDKKKVSLKVFFDISYTREKVRVTGKWGAVDVRKTTVGVDIGPDIDPETLAKIKLRGAGKPLLFFKHIETGEDGNAEIEFETSDRLSTYRIMAVAYDEDSFGSAEKQFLVSKKLLLQEAMPEFARENDSFRAGVMVSSRRNKKVKVAVIARPEHIQKNSSQENKISKNNRIVIEGKDRQRITIDKKSNRLVQFDFKAERAGEAGIEFYAITKKDRDGLLKKIPVNRNLVSESLIDFQAGKTISKQVQPVQNAVEQQLNMTVSPTLTKPAALIAKKLILYPYECLEQQTSRVLPFLVLNNRLIESLDLDIDREQAARTIKTYLAMVPEFLCENGALSYYRGGRWSPFLSLYVLQALYLAKEKGYEVSEKLIEKIEGYTDGVFRILDNECYYLYILSFKKAPGKKLPGKKFPRKKFLEDIFQRREELRLMGKAFLYKALHRHLGDREKTGVLLREFNNALVVEADFAYFDPGSFYYDPDIPFYSSRFVTALLLQAILEVEGEHVYADRIMKWLLQCKPHYWNTTQVNYRILLALNEYLEKVAKEKPRQVKLDVLGKEYDKTFEGAQDVLQVEKAIPAGSGLFTVEAVSDGRVYLNTELRYKLKDARAKNRGIEVKRLVYNDKGKIAQEFQKGRTYQVEILIDPDKEVPYGVIDEPLAAGFEVIREDIAFSRALSPFNNDNKEAYRTPWLRKGYRRDRIHIYTYRLKGKIRVVYFVKALYSGAFTWLPTEVRGMYHPQYYGRTATERIIIKE